MTTAQRRCPSCGKTVYGTDDRCMECGAYLSAAPTRPTRPVVRAPGQPEPGKEGGGNFWDKVAEQLSLPHEGDWEGGVCTLLLFLTCLLPLVGLLMMLFCRKDYGRSRGRMFLVWVGSAMLLFLLAALVHFALEGAAAVVTSP